MGYRVLTALIVAAHFAYLGYVVFGGFLAWRWPRALWPHLVAVGWGVTIVVADLVADGLTCPLTYIEDWSRRQAGEAGLTAGFIDRYIEGVLYPERYATAAQVLAGCVVLVAWLGRYRRRRRGGRPTGSTQIAQRSQIASDFTTVASSQPLEMPHSSS